MRNTPGSGHEYVSTGQWYWDGLTFSLCHELGRLWEILNYPETRNTYDNREKAFEDEDPSPAIKTRNTIHVVDSRGE